LIPRKGRVRIAMFAAMAALLVVALCVPEAFGDHALAFAIAYALVRGVLRLRNARTLNRQRFVVALLLLALWPFADEVSALATLAVANVLIWAMIAYEVGTYDERRYRLRHRLEYETPG
jgi:low temperature requirement protein LtrA